MPSPAQGLFDTIGAQVMQPAQRGMDLLQNIDPQVLKQLLASLGLGGGGEQPLPIPPSQGRDIALPNQSGQVDPRIQRTMMLQRMRGGQ